LKLIAELGRERSRPLVIDRILGLFREGDERGFGHGLSDRLVEEKTQNTIDYKGPAAFAAELRDSFKKTAIFSARWGLRRNDLTRSSLSLWERAAQSPSPLGEGRGEVSVLSSTAQTAPE